MLFGGGRFSSSAKFISQPEKWVLFLFLSAAGVVVVVVAVAAAPQVKSFDTLN